MAGFIVSSSLQLAASVHALFVVSAAASTLLTSWVLVAESSLLAQPCAVSSLLLSCVFNAVSVFVQPCCE